MKRKIFGKITIALALIGVMAGCNRQDNSGSDGDNDQNEQSVNSLSRSTSEQAITNVEINVNNNDFTIQMNDTPTGRSLVSMIPSSSMRLPTSYDRDGILKYYDMAREVESDPEEISSVSAGELLLDGNDRLLLYYKDTDLSGEYTRVGKIENADNLADVLGNEDVIFTVARVSE